MFNDATLRKCIKLTEAIKRMSKTLEDLADKHSSDDEYYYRFFRSLRDFAWDTRMRAENREELIDAAKDLFDPERHKPTERFSQPRRAA